MENSKPTQCERVIKYIKKHGSITQREADRKIGVMRLASRISELRKAGFKIIADTVVVSNRWGEKSRIKRYSFAEGEDNEQRETD